jgi:hypothetical protein
VDWVVNVFGLECPILTVIHIFMQEIWTSFLLNLPEVSWMDSEICKLHRCYICCHWFVASWVHYFTCYLDVMVKLSLCLTKHYSMKTYWGSGGIVPYILDLGTRRRWVVSFTPRPLYPQGKCPWYPLDRRWGGPQSHSGHGGEEKYSHPPHRESNPRIPIVQPVAQRYTDWAITALVALMYWS